MSSIYLLFRMQFCPYGYSSADKLAKVSKANPARDLVGVTQYQALTIIHLSGTVLESRYLWLGKSENRRENGSNLDWLYDLEMSEAQVYLFLDILQQ